MKKTLYLLLALTLMTACQEPETVGYWDNSEGRAKPYVELTECYAAHAVQGDKPTTLVYVKGRVNNVATGVSGAVLGLKKYYTDNVGTANQEYTVPCTVVGSEFEYMLYGTTTTVRSDSKISDGDLADAIAITRCTYSDEAGFTVEASFDERIQDVQRAGFVYSALNYSISYFTIGGDATATAFCSVASDRSFSLNVPYLWSVKVRAFVVLGNGRVIYGNQLLTTQRE